MAQIISEFLAYILVQLGAEHIRDRYGIGGCLAVAGLLVGLLAFAVWWF